MLNTRSGRVSGIIHEEEDYQEIIVLVEEGEEGKAINYPLLTGKVAVGDLVVVNTTAVDLDLGTGGYHFVMHGFSKSANNKLNKDQHIMKLRYTPMQVAVGSCEEQGSPYHGVFWQHQSIQGMPVLIGELHSMLPVAAAYIKSRKKDARIAYIMTDKGCLPLVLSRHVRWLKEKEWLAGTITIGQAFGGDFEAVNIYTALLTAKHILRADLAIVTMGPGIVGTGTPLGFSGMEQVEHLHAAHSMGGIPILIPRVGRGDLRIRHQGISHHTYTVLRHTLGPVHIPIFQEIQDVSEHSPPYHQWHVKNREAMPALHDLLNEYGHPVQSMGRGLKEDPLFFDSIALAADFALFMAIPSNDLSCAKDPSQLWTDSTIL